MGLDHNSLMKVLDWAYDKAIGGIPGFDSAQEIAEAYSKNDGSKADQCNALIRWQVAKASASGFVSGLGGLVTLPVAIPANIGSVLFVQLRMIAAIAHIGGHDVREDRVRTLVFLCLCGNGAIEIAKDMGIHLGVKLAQGAIKSVSGRTLIKINQRVGFRLLTKFGEKGVLNLGKAVPFVGGIIGGAVDGATTKAVGDFALRTFVEAA